MTGTEHDGVSDPPADAENGRPKLEFGYEYFKTAPAGLAAAEGLRRKGNEVIAAAKAGEPPIQVIAPFIEQWLWHWKVVRHADRMIREWLGPSYVVQGRRQWPWGGEMKYGYYYTRM